MNNRTRVGSALLTVVGLLLASTWSSGAAAGGSSETDGASRAGASAGRAVAARAERTVTANYSKYRMIHVSDFNFCLGVWAKATMKAVRESRATPHSEPRHFLRDPEIHDSYMLVTIKKSCDDSAGPRKKHRANRVRYEINLYGYTCSFDPSFSAGLPWAVAVSVTPDCGDENTARNFSAERHTSRAYRFELDTDGYDVEWDDKTGAVGPGNAVKLCTSVSTNYRLRDTKGAVRLNKLIKTSFPDICVSST